jgi:hypothetical protein
MPIKPENVEKYPADWSDIRERVLLRDGAACQFCRAPNHTYVVRLGGTAYWAWAPIEIAMRRVGATTPEPAVLARECAELADASSSWRDGDGEHVPMSVILQLPARRYAHVTEIVLTIAHLDNALEDHSDDNLAALCQRCHLTHDATMRKRTAAASQLGFSL